MNYLCNIVLLVDYITVDWRFTDYVTVGDVMSPTSACEGGGGGVGSGSLGEAGTGCDEGSLESVHNLPIDPNWVSKVPQFLIDGVRAERIVPVAEVCVFSMPSYELTLISWI